MTSTPCQDLSRPADPAPLRPVGGDRTCGPAPSLPAARRRGLLAIPSGITLPLLRGWFEGHEVLYITTDVSSAGIAQAKGANFSPRLADALPAGIGGGTWPPHVRGQGLQRDQPGAGQRVCIGADADRPSEPRRCLQPSLAVGQGHLGIRRREARGEVRRGSSRSRRKGRSSARRDRRRSQLPDRVARSMQVAHCPACPSHVLLGDALVARRVGTGRPSKNVAKRHSAESHLLL